MFRAYHAAASSDLVTLIATGAGVPVLVVYFFFKWTALLFEFEHAVTWTY